MSTFCPTWASWVERRSDGYTRFEVDQVVTVVAFAGWKANARLVAADGRWLINPICGHSQRYLDDNIFPTVQSRSRSQEVTFNAKGPTLVKFRGVDQSAGFGPPSYRGVQRFTVNATGFSVETMPGEPLSAEEIALRIIGGRP